MPWVNVTSIIMRGRLFPESFSYHVCELECLLKMGFHLHRVFGCSYTDLHK